ncbi:MAG TPA: hypothetical protein PLS03_16030 [Terrimicrobiaceae bacterium]|nr:hypothetical protein [Terrimicrobiaceae bacterium]
MVPPMARRMRWLDGVSVLLAALTLGSPLFAADPVPHGEYLELHACEVYTGGCTASAQATQGGRSVVRVWKFSDDPARNAGLAGLAVVVLQVADANLAMPDTPVRSSIVYVPSQASKVQRQGLIAWLAANGVQSGDVKVAEISYRREGAVAEVSAGTGLRFRTRALEACDAGGCGEQLWYSPRGKTGAYTVLVNDQSVVEEPALALSWKDHAAKSVFFGKFGTPESADFTLAAMP